MPLSLYNKTLCHTLSNALEENYQRKLSRKTSLTSKLGLVSKALKISWTIEMSGCTQSHRDGILIGELKAYF